MKKIYLNDDSCNLIFGKDYYVECGIWEATVTFVNRFKKNNHFYYRFTFGDVENWTFQFNLVATKSNLKVYDFEEC